MGVFGIERVCAAVVFLTFTAEPTIPAAPNPIPILPADLIKSLRPTLLSDVIISFRLCDRVKPNMRYPIPANLSFLFPYHLLSYYSGIKWIPKQIIPTRLFSEYNYFCQFYFLKTELK